MKEKNNIEHKLLKAENKARSGKFGRFLRAPVLYPSLMVFNHLFYPLFKKGIYTKANTFFGIPIRTLLPSGTDILLNGIKSHDSEIRLTRFLTRELHEGDVFIDVGAHNGYYSLLSSVLVGKTGHVYSIEASASSFSDLKENVERYSNIKVFHAAAGDQAGTITFFEYPGPYAEYNTTIPNTYQDQKWFHRVKQKVNKVPVLMLDHLFKSEDITKAIVKIDVEGGEASVLSGMLLALNEKELIIAMEYLLPVDGSLLHQQAADILYRAGYQAHAITPSGELLPVSGIEEYLVSQKLNSDNIVFK